MQPFPSDPAPHRGFVWLVALLVVGFLLAATIAILQFVRLRAANERIEDLEERGPSAAAGEAPAEREDGGLFGDLDELLEGLGDGGELLGGADSLIECLGPSFDELGEAGRDIDEIVEQVEEIRGLSFVDEVEPRFLTNDEMTKRVRTLFLEEYTPGIADLEQRLLTALGAIPRGTDLRELRADTIGQQVAGFYEPETGELVVRQGTTELSTLDRITLAHELTHALTDQTLGIPLPEDPEVGREDADLAALALVEGDATLVMQRFAATLGFDEQLGLLDPEAIAASEAGLGDLPPYLEQELLFAYEEGLSFVCELYARGGWRAVDRAYRAPPESTAEILFPARYRGRSDEPVEVPDPGPPGRGWTLEAELQVGAANLLWLLEAPGGERERALSEAEPAVAAWAGGEAAVWGRGDRTAVGISLVERPGEEVLCPAVVDWYRASFEGDREQPGPRRLVADGERQDAVVLCTEEGVRVGIGPDTATAMAQTR